MVFPIAVASILDAISRWDTAWFYVVNLGTQNGLFDMIMPLLSDIKLWRIPLLVVSLAAVILGNRKVRATVLLAALALVLSDQISSQLLKPLVARERPSHVLEGVRLLMGRGGRYGFPSSHAATPPPPPRRTIGPSSIDSSHSKRPRAGAPPTQVRTRLVPCRPLTTVHQGGARAPLTEKLVSPAPVYRISRD